MRKKSHISLAGYLVRELQMEELEQHKKAFYLGSILPDLTPKMLTSPHEFDTSFEKLQESICDLVAGAEDEECKDRVLWRRIGVIMHYLADYFTFPHNVSFDGSLKDHCLYERDMKYQLREYVRTREAEQIFRSQRHQGKRLHSMEELFRYIERTHRAYMRKEHSVADDCRWIIELCSRVLISIVEMIGAVREGMTVALYQCA